MDYVLTERNGGTDKRGNGVPENGRGREKVNEFDEGWDMGNQ